MSAIVVQCPTARVFVATGQHATQAKFEDEDFSGRFRCTACGAIHDWVKADARMSPRALRPA